MGTGNLLGTLHDSGHRDSRFTKLRRVTGTTFSLGSLGVDNSPSFQAGLGEAQFCGSLVLGSGKFLVGLPTVWISCFLSLKGKSWEEGGRGDYFHPERLPQSSGVLPGLKHGIYKAVKNNPLAEQKAWERGWPGESARGWERWVRTGNVHPRPWEGFYSRRIMRAQRD